MKLLGKVTDEFLGLVGEVENCPRKEREASRAIVFNNEGNVALVYTEKHGHHKLPGGGIDDGESILEAIERECIEEVGCEVKARDVVIGKIEEERNQHNFFQTSYCGVADVVKDLGEAQLTELEISDGYQPPIWVPLKEAVNILKNDKPKTYLGHHMCTRDLMFLEEALKVL